MRHFWIVSIGACVALVALTSGVRAQNAERKYAAVAANEEGDLKVVWAATKERASELALSACKRQSKTCASEPATTTELDDVFVLMCCTSPRFVCVSPSHENKEKAEAVALKMMSDRGNSRCTPKAYYSARTGQRLP